MTTCKGINGIECKTKANFNFYGKSAEFCRKHADEFCEINKIKEKMIDVKQKLCNPLPVGDKNITCTNRATHGFPADKIRLCCSTHKEKGMIDFNNKRCQYFNIYGDNKDEICDSCAIYNELGKTPGLFCFYHKILLEKEFGIEYEYIGANKCKFIGGCNIIAKFNEPGLKIGKYCSKHKKDSHINVKLTLCKLFDCPDEAIYGYKCDKIKLYCKNHKELGMIELKHPLCEGKDGIECDKNATFSIKGETKLRYCKNCFPENEIKIDNKHKKCIICKKARAIYALPGLCPEHCFNCRINKNLERKSPTKKYKCLCGNEAFYGKNKSQFYLSIPIHCENHKENDEVNLIEIPCKSCGLEYKLNKNNKCINCENEIIQYKLKKQNQIKKFLDNNNIEYLHNDKSINNGECGKERPDFMFLSKNKLFYIILEVDEEQHKSYKELCECVRMVNIFYSLEGLKVLFIRYNPDDYKVDEKKNKTEITTRLKKLKTYLNYYLNLSDLPYFCQTKQLFYDNWIDNYDVEHIPIL